MNTVVSSRVRASTLPVTFAGRQRGVVMFIALLVMVALSLAGIALIRSADTATIVSGNLAFKQAAVYAVDRSVEQAVAGAVRPGSRSCTPGPGDRRQDGRTVLAQNYYACVRNAAGTGVAAAAPTAPIPEIPAALTQAAAQPSWPRPTQPPWSPTTQRRQQEPTT